MNDEERRMFSNRLREAHAEIERLRANERPFVDTIKQLTADVERLRAALQEIADMRYDNTSAAAIAGRALEPKP